MAWVWILSSQPKKDVSRSWFTSQCCICCVASMIDLFIVLHYTAQYWTVLHYAGLYCTILYCTWLNYTSVFLCLEQFSDARALQCGNWLGQLGILRGQCQTMDFVISWHFLNIQDWIYSVFHNTSVNCPSITPSDHINMYIRHGICKGCLCKHSFSLE